jgi:sialate O-acetylesterase
MGRKYQTVANRLGNWKLQITAAKAGMGGDMDIRSGSEKLIIQDILIGEVWVCSGQSNMEWKMNQMKEAYTTALQTCNNPQIRYVTVEKNYMNRENKDTRLERKWTAIDTASLGNCSAVAYYYAKKLYERLHVPIGLVVTSWGGTPIQSWMDTASLKPFSKDYAVYKKEISSLDFSALPKMKQDIDERFTKNIIQESNLFKEKIKPAYDDAGWKQISVLKDWEEQGYPDIDGIAAYRVHINLAPEFAGKEAVLHLPAIDDFDSTYINGQFLGGLQQWDQLRVYTIPAGVLKAGDNVISIWVQDNQGGGGLFGDIKNYYLQIDEQKISLPEKANFKILVKIENLSEHVTFASIQNQPVVLFDAMIAPLLNLSIQGAIWYQGEANVPGYKAYRKLFPAMIKGWRARWKQGDFPFLFCQLSSFNPATTEPLISDWAGLREAQTMTLRLPNTGMAVTTDIGERYDIHPLHKQEVGERLALNAFNKAYGFTREVYSGPVFETAKSLAGKLQLSFAQTGSGLMVKGDTLKGFYIAGANKHFIQADAVIQGSYVSVFNKKIIVPVYVRYAWANAPLEANLFNREGIPAIPFRTDHD